MPPLTALLDRAVAAFEPLLNARPSDRDGAYHASVSEWQSCRPNLEVADLGPATAFLRDVLGFTVEMEEQAMGLVLLSRDAVGLALVRADSPGVNQTTAAYIGVTDVDGLHDHCQRHGATVVMPLTDHPWGLRDFVIEIPGGHRLALGERISGP